MSISADGAAWRATVWKGDTWLARHPERHDLFRLPGVSIMAYVPDLMHVLHLGCYQYVFGSVLVYLTDHRMPMTRDQNLNTLWQSIRESYKARGVYRPPHFSRDARAYKKTTRAINITAPCGRP